MTTDDVDPFAPIRKAIAAGTKKFLAALRRDWKRERMYALLLEVNAEGTNIFAVAATEEGLTRIADKYAEHRGPGAIERQRNELRWGSPEDGWYAAYDADYFERANDLLEKAHAQGLIEMYDGKLNQIALDALKEMDAAGLFGKGEAREQIVLGLCYVGGDNSEEEFLAWAKQVNSPPVLRRLRRELKEAE